jgi:hypothetical protein
VGNVVRCSFDRPHLANGGSRMVFKLARSTRRQFQRLFLCMLLASLLVAWALLIASPRIAISDDWVRTRDGWEHAESLRPHRVYEPAVHPLVVTSLVTLASLLGLVGFSRWKNTKPDNSET